MRVELAGEFRELTIQREGSVASESTGRGLRRVEVAFACGGRLVDAVRDQLDEASARLSRRTPMVDDEGTQWAVGDWSYSYRESEPPSTEFTVELSEVERLNATRLRFAGLDVPVEHYREIDAREEDGMRLLIAEFVADHEVTEQIRQLADSDGYFDLVRVGITDEPLSVRFGRYLWAWVDGEGSNLRRFHAPFVTERGDEEGDGGEDPRAWHTSRMAVMERARTAALLDELVAAGVIDSDARARINQAGEDAWPRDRFDLREVEDVTTHRWP